MSRITVSEIWSDGWALVNRHMATVGPVAAAFLFLPQVLDAAITGPLAPGETPSGFGSLIAAIVGLFGQLAIVAILLGGPRGPATVGEALVQAGRLLPRMVLVLVLLILMALPVMLAAGAALAALGIKPDPASIRAGGLPVSIIVTGLLALGLYVAARLAALLPVIVGEGQGALASIRRGWAVTRGEGSRVTLFFISFFAVALFVSVLALIVGGAVIGLLLGASAFSQLLQATVVGVFAAVLGLFNLGASVAIYRRLAQ